MLIRKLLDFVFTRQELKILDDIMPESTKRKREEEKELKKKGIDGDGSGETGTGLLLKNASSGNVSIPLANGNILKIPVDKITNKNLGNINISEQLSKSGAWTSIDNEKQNGKSDNFNKLKKRNVTKKDAINEEEQKRLSTMREEDDEEDCGITIKVDAPTPRQRSVPNEDSKNGETPV